MKPKTISFLLFPGLHVLDLSGSVQAFYEANQLGHLPYKIVYTSLQKEIVTEQKLVLSSLSSPNETILEAGDYIIIPGTDFRRFKAGELNSDIQSVKDWLKLNFDSGVNIASICSGSLILASAGLLDGKSCTTHWKCIDYMNDQFPKVNVQTDTLFVNSNGIYSSAGMTSGIDMSLSIIEEHQGPIVSSKVAREMVVYLRRHGTSSQNSIYLDYHTHFNPIVHKAQNYIVSHPSENPTLEHLAKIANTSVRNLTRAFKTATGGSISDYKKNIKIELARHLLNNPNYTIEHISEMCGFKAPRQLQRLWKEKFAQSISEFRQR